MSFDFSLPEGARDLDFRAIVTQNSQIIGSGTESAHGSIHTPNQRYTIQVSRQLIYVCSRSRYRSDIAPEHTLPVTATGSSGIDSASGPAATEVFRGVHQSVNHTHSTRSKAGTTKKSMASRDSLPKFATAHYKLTNLVDSLIQYLYYLVEQEEDTLSWMHAHELEQRGCLKGWLSTVSFLNRFISLATGPKLCSLSQREPTQLLR